MCACVHTHVCRKLSRETRKENMRKETLNRGGEKKADGVPVTGRQKGSSGERQGLSRRSREVGKEGGEGQSCMKTS